MHAYLLTGDDNATETYIQSFIKNKGLIRSDRLIKSIADSRALIKDNSLKILTPTAIVIKNIDQATEEALNSMLKEIEEPQANITFIFTSIFAQKVIPTILSRCQIINLSNVNDSYDDTGETFVQADTGKRFFIASQIKKREDAIKFVGDLIVSMSKKLAKDPNITYSQNVDICNQVLYNLNKNANVLLQMTILVISLK